MTHHTATHTHHHVANQLKGAKIQGSASLHDVLGQFRGALGNQQAIDANSAQSGLLSDRFDA